MNKAFNQLKFIFLLIAVMLSKNVSVFAAAEVLTTDHFIINYNINNSCCALAMAVKLESYNERITSFLEFDPLDKINIYISGNENKKNIINSGSGAIYINTGGNFSLIEDFLYSKIFRIYLQKITNNGKGLSEIDESLVGALMIYPDRDHQLNRLIREDLVNNLKIDAVDFKRLNNLNRYELNAIYTVLIDFIISDYGKKKLVQSIKDTDYYGGFFEALSEITGDSFTALSEKFNLFLHKQNSDISPKPENRKPLYHDNDEFTDISYSVSGNEQAAVLQRADNIFRLLLKNGNGRSFIKLKHYENGSFFSDIVFISCDQVALVEVIGTGSIIHTYDIKTDKYLTGTILPFLFISDISFLADKNMIFSASCGLDRDIYTFNISSGEFRILTESGCNFSPIVLKDKVYFISRNGRNNIVELDSITGVQKILFSTDQMISHLNRAADRSLLLTLKINGLGNVFTYDLLSGNLCQIFKDNSSNLSPEISGKYIYFLAFYKNSYKLFYNTLNPVDF